MTARGRRKPSGGDDETGAGSQKRSRFGVGSTDIVRREQPVCAHNRHDKAECDPRQSKKTKPMRSGHRDGTHEHPYGGDREQQDGQRAEHRPGILDVGAAIIDG